MKFALSFAMALMAEPAIAQHMSDRAVSGMQMGRMHQSRSADTGTEALHESGQSAFAAIAEAVTDLERNPKTNWSKVNIDMLRQHLVDMDNVIVHSNVSRHDVPGGARFEITSKDPAVRTSIDRMVQLHASMANEEGRYRLTTDPLPNGTALTVLGSSAAEEMKIRALGFFGLLTQGIHHQQHHLMLAKGEQMHP